MPALNQTEVLQTLRKELEHFLKTCQQQDLDEIMARTEPYLCRPLEQHLKSLYYYYKNTDKEEKLQELIKKKNYRMEICLKSNRQLLLNLLVSHKRLILKELSSLHCVRDSKKTEVFLKELQSNQDNFRNVMFLIDKIFLIKGSNTFIQQVNSRATKSNKKGTELILEVLNEMVRTLKKFRVMVKIVEQNAKYHKSCKMKGGAHVHAEINKRPVVIAIKKYQTPVENIQNKNPPTPPIPCQDPHPPQKCPLSTPHGGASCSESITGNDSFLDIQTRKISQTSTSEVFLQKIYSLMNPKKSKSQMILNQLIVRERFACSLKRAKTENLSHRKAETSKQDAPANPEPPSEPFYEVSDCSAEHKPKCEQDKLEKWSGEANCFADSRKLYVPSIASLPKPLSSYLQNQIDPRCLNSEDCVWYSNYLINCSLTE